MAAVIAAVGLAGCGTASVGLREQPRAGAPVSVESTGGSPLSVKPTGGGPASAQSTGGAPASVKPTAGHLGDAAAVRAASSHVEPTAGRLGAATAVRVGGSQVELSSGGRLDVQRRGGAPRRDGVAAGGACPDPALAPSAETAAAVSEATLCLLNGERADHGLAPLAPNEKLAAAASAYARDLVAGSYFSHTGRDGSQLLDRIERSGYLPRGAGWALGENLAWGTGALAVPGAIMQAWMNSPGHRANILNPDYREIGVGIVTGNPAAADGLGATYATEFGAIEGEPAPRAKRSRKRSRRHVTARQARRAPRGEGRGRARGKRRGRVKARIAI